MVDDDDDDDDDPTPTTPAAGGSRSRRGKKWHFTAKHCIDIYSICTLSELM